MQLQELGGGVGYFKGGLYGFAGSGKTHTATLFAIGIKKQLALPGRIAMFDTETGVEYVDPMILAATGQHPIGAKSRSLADAIDFLSECVKQKVAVAIVDSVTHIWDEVQKSYLRQINESRVRRNLKEKSNIEWQDRGPLNDLWGKFTDSYLNSPLHIILCGRAANLWEMQTNEEGKKELNKIGTKMKTQSDMAYEPALLGEMERTQEYKDGKQVITRVLTVLKDRYRDLDGKQFDNPTFESIKPHVDHLTAGASNAVDTTRQTAFPVTDEGDVEWNAEKKKRAIYSEELQGALMASYPGQSSDDKKAKATLIYNLFGTYSWTAVESMDSAKLKTGLDALPAAIAAYRKNGNGNGDTSAAPIPAPKPIEGKAAEVVAKFGGAKEADKDTEKLVKKGGKK